MESAVTGQQMEALKAAIVFMKMDELRAVCRALGIAELGQKRQLITRVIHRISHQRIADRMEGGADSGRSKTKLHRAGVQEYSIQALLRPETYTNGAKARAFLKLEIGDHFHFTTFGMDWIKEQWAAGRTPSFGEFIEFWKAEWKARQQRKNYESKPELARVNFFRRVSGSRKVGRAELEKLWKVERAACLRRPSDFEPGVWSLDNREETLRLN